MPVAEISVVVGHDPAFAQAVDGSRLDVGRGGVDRRLIGVGRCVGITGVIGIGWRVAVARRSETGAFEGLKSPVRTGPRSSRVAEPWAGRAA